MTNIYSTLGIQIINSSNLSNASAALQRLAEQLATGKKSLDLGDYTTTDAKQLLSFNESINQRNGFIAVANTIDTRLKIYDRTLSGIEDIAALASSLISGAPQYVPEQSAAQAETIKGYMQQVYFYLNQSLGDRYLFAGSRYDTAPVTDLTALPVPPTETDPYTVDADAVPSYDAEYDSLNPALAVPDAWVKDEVAVDVTTKMQYGITSTDTGFQQLIMGLRFAYAATQDSANYNSYMATATGLITKGLTAIRGYHTDLSANQANLTSIKTANALTIADLQQSIGDIQNVDTNEVATKITFFQTQLEASYAATGRIIKLTILNYL